MLDTHYDDETDYRDHDSSAPDREISVGTSSIVVIFFVLALICAVFFGVGYTLGRRQAQGQIQAQVIQPTTSAFSGNTKPAPGSFAKIPSTSVAPADTTPAPAPQAIEAPVTIKTPPPAPVEKAIEIPATRPVPAPVAAPATTSVAGAQVQIAAVSHREDADVLVAALTRRGYDVAIRNEAQDKLLHVQIGPFPTRKDAEAMRQRLLADGYNAIVK
jgi:DedD protein